MTRAAELQAARAKGPDMTYKDEADLLDAIPDLLAFVRALEEIAKRRTEKGMGGQDALDMAWFARDVLAVFNDGGKP